MKILTALGIAAIFILLMYLFPHTMLSPGVLVEGHQELKNKCMSCHAPFGGIENEKCIACHPLADIGKDSLMTSGKPPFHQALTSQSCTSCHTDHAGLQPQSSLRSFNHELLDKTMINECIRCHQQPTDELHQQVTSNCKNCHDTKAWKLSSPFNHDNLVPESKNNCAACHKAPMDDMHKFSTANCDKCHSTTQWVPSTFAHDAYFRLDNDHNAKCTVCHLTNNYTTYTCYGCHEHTAAGMKAEHSEEGINNITDCVSCHKSADEDGAERNKRNGSSQNGNNTNEGGNNQEEDD